MGSNPKIQTDDDHSPTSTPAPAREEKKTETEEKSDDKARGRTLRPRGTDRAQERSVSPGTMPGKIVQFAAIVHLERRALS